MRRTGREAGVGRRTVYDWFAGDAQFKAAFDEALAEAIEHVDSRSRLGLSSTPGGQAARRTDAFMRVPVGTNTESPVDFCTRGAAAPFPGLVTNRHSTAGCGLADAGDSMAGSLLPSPSGGR